MNNHSCKILLGQKKNLCKQIFLEIIPEVQFTKNKSISQNETQQGNGQLRQCRTLLWFYCVSPKLAKFNIIPPALTGGTFKRQQSQESSQPTRVDYQCHSQPTRGDYRYHSASVPTGLALPLQDDAPRRSSKALAFWENFVYYKLSSTVCSVTVVQK